MHSALSAACLEDELAVHTKGYCMYQSKYQLLSTLLIQIAPYGMNTLQLIVCQSTNVGDVVFKCSYFYAIIEVFNHHNHNINKSCCVSTNYKVVNVRTWHTLHFEIFTWCYCIQQCQ